MERIVVLTWVMFLIIARTVDAMSRQQLKNSGKILRKQCLSKSGAAEEKIQNIAKGTFIEEREVMCYMACIYQLTQTVKKNRLDYTASIKQIDMIYPPEMKGPAKAAIEACKDIFSSKKHNDVCECCYWSAKCMYEYDPNVFIFP